MRTTIREVEAELSHDRDDLGMDTCPYIPGKRYVDWDLPDPQGRPVDEVRAIRDDIARAA